MAIPLPEAVKLGGDWVGSSEAANALTKSSLENAAKAIENQYAPEKNRLANETSQESLNQARRINPLEFKQKKNELAKAEFMQELYNRLLGNNKNNSQMQNSTSVQNAPHNEQSGSNLSASTSANNMQNMPNVSPPSNTNNINNIPPSQPINKAFSNLTYPQAALAMHGLGLGKPEIKELDGNLMAITPFGNIPIAQGLTPSQKSYEKGKGEYEAKSRGESIEAFKGLQNQDLALDSMINQIDNPEFRNVTGPVKSFFVKWSGNPAQQELLGNLQSSSGEIALQVAPALKGAFTGRDQTLINTIKANPNTDMADIFIGKLKAQKLIGTALMERARLAASYQDRGMSSLDANAKAAKETPLSRFKPEIDKLINSKKKNPTGTRIMYKNNEEYHIPENKVKAALKAGYSYGR